MSPPIGPLGILGGGQLGRMLAQAAADLGLDVVVGERFARSPAARLASAEVVFGGGWNDPAAIEMMASLAPLITLENEFVDASVLDQIEAHGSRVVPTPACVRLVQDKLVQKQTLAAAGLAVAPFQPAPDPTSLKEFARQRGWPVVLKARQGGYDGYGNALLRGPRQAADRFARLGWPARALYVESYVPYQRELAVMVVRSPLGQSVTYPVAETRQHPERHVCESVIVPADISAACAARAGAIAVTAVEAVNGTGAFGVELFLLPDGQILVNELAPRPHNSGHYTIEACGTSQFANHVRAVLGLPLGDTALRRPAAAMVNLLGRNAAAPGTRQLNASRQSPRDAFCPSVDGKQLIRVGPPTPCPSRQRREGEAATFPWHQLAAALAQPDVYVHLYGKGESRPWRKMGHVTALGETPAAALDRAERAAAELPT